MPVDGSAVGTLFFVFINPSFLPSLSKFGPIAARRRSPRRHHAEHAVGSAWERFGAAAATLLIPGRRQEFAQPAKDNVPDAPQSCAD